jgi:RHH-type rel operon transcriptional repressor/antitoxin RelB
MSSGTPKEVITVRVAPRKRAMLDKLARATDRDRSYIVDAAIDAYLAIRAWQIKRVKDGLRQADAGEFATDAEVIAAYERWR